MGVLTDFVCGVCVEVRSPVCMCVQTRGVRGVHGVCLRVVYICSGVCVVGGVWYVVSVEGACVSVFKGVCDNRKTRVK